MSEQTPIKNFFRRLSQKFNLDKKSTPAASSPLAAVKEDKPATAEPAGEPSSADAAATKEVEVAAAPVAEAPATPAAEPAKEAETPAVTEPGKAVEAPAAETAPVTEAAKEEVKEEVKEEKKEEAKEEAAPAPEKKIPVSAAEFQKEYKDHPLIADADFAKYNAPASGELYAEAVEGLTKAGFIVHQVATKEEALEVLKGLAPEGASVSNGSSTGLIEVGFIDFLKYKNFHALLLAEQDQAKAAKLRQEGYSADYFFASPNAISSSGSLITADLTGTKTAGLIASSNVVFFAGSNKIVAGGIEEAHKRVEDFAVKVESLRAHLVYGVERSVANNIVVLSGSNPWGPKRIHVVLSTEAYGF
ncbi:DUF1121-domain-containing protein [Gonapodya prolifera JEL478]|uniref:DUF1121-domain-containing protein n=1 Tax=Gonapodya prolifera (strain JEL478) TaxID=1344416 RepID=A0A139AGU4_GONPJ|nr:DUF1121-domain-containing protein [Gonapodya prolifera JEL478]|eukprot:KXS15909.1 DUF1121-domain-containing protein [Gonapodya prolifera JEL478]